MMTLRSLLLPLGLATSLVAGAILAAPTARADESTLRIVKFEADWCGPCQRMKPVFEKVARTSPEDVTFETVDVDAQGALADRYGVRSLPTVVALKNGREVGRTVGYKNAFQLRLFVMSHR